MIHDVGFSARRYIVPLLIASLGLSCAGPNKLAQQSEKAYQAGEVEKAYQKAAKALRKEPNNERARSAMTQAATRIMDGRKSEIRRLAVGDTVAAAQTALALEPFRRQLSDYRVILSPDPAFERDESAIRLGAAAIEYRLGRADLEAGFPKRAYYEFQQTRIFEPDHRDVDRRIQEAYDEALPRVALLPFANQTDLPVLSKEFVDQTYEELTRRIGVPSFRFTEILPRERVYDVVPVSMLDRVNRKDAARLGRELGADRVIVGRFYGLRSSTDTGNFSQTVFHKVVDKDDKGATRERFVEMTLDLITRNRELSVGYEYQVLDAADGSVVDGNSGTMAASAHVIFTSAQVSGDCSDYCLASPDLKSSNSDRANRIEADWGERCGDWKLPEILEHARKERSRGAYEPRFRDEFKLSSASRPVFLGDVPPEGDLAELAFGQVWEPLLRTLTQVDQNEPTPAGGGRP
jgi:tetratricopeptide (TPR) repeat protein